MHSLPDDDARTGELETRDNLPSTRTLSERCECETEGQGEKGAKLRGELVRE